MGTIPSCPRSGFLVLDKIDTRDLSHIDPSQDSPGQSESHRQIWKVWKNREKSNAKMCQANGVVGPKTLSD